jgi:glucosamine--fructose-6-phosphate aminotransferase (isomerizing)
MKQPGQHTYHEIITQPDAWVEAIAAGEAARARLQELWRRTTADEILFTGCGSTYYLSLAAAALARQNGLAARAAPASEIWLSTLANAPHAERTLLVAVSRSGATTETLRAVECFRRAGGRAVAAATCYPASALAQVADLTLGAPQGQEQSMAQTRSFSSMLLLCQGIINALQPATGYDDRMAGLPPLGRWLIAHHADLAAQLGGDRSLQRFFFLGNGPRYGLACEAMLKMKEMSLSYSEAYHMLEFRHGPKSMVNENTLVVGLLSDDLRAYEEAVLADMRKLGARTLTIADGLSRAQGGLQSGDTVVPLNPAVPIAEHLVLYLPVLQLLAYHRALLNKVDPDAPKNLSAVVEL